MILGPLSRVMTVRQPFCAKNMQTSKFLYAKFSPARAVLYLQMNRALLWSNRTAQRFNTTAGVRNYGTTRWFYKTVWCHSFSHLWRCYIFVQICWITIRTKFSTKKVWSLHVFFERKKSCLTIITLLRGPKIIIWTHVLCQVHHPFNNIYRASCKKKCKQVC